MKRRDLQELSRLRLREAAALLKAGCPDGAYYLAGHALECAIKACIAKQTERFEFPNRKRANDSWTHDLDTLVRTAGLDKALEAAQKTKPALNLNWSIVRQWSIESRYQRHTDTGARELLAAIGSRRDGVLSWFKHHW